MIPYPTKDQVLTADRKQVYRWFLLLRLPGFSKWDKKSGRFISDPTVPENAREIINLIFNRWRELGGRDLSIAEDILREEFHGAPLGSDTARSEVDVDSAPQGV